MSCCGGACSCSHGLYLGFTEENTSSTPGSIILGVAPEKGIGEAPEKASESGDAGQGCCCGSGCTCC